MAFPLQSMAECPTLQREYMRTRSIQTAALAVRESFLPASRCEMDPGLQLGQSGRLKAGSTQSTHQWIEG
eukprot:scaffold8805_cov109-Cylindrotheca_fusiformis.AAC.3